MAWDASPWETKADDAVVRANSEQLYGLAGRITGRGSDLKSTINKGAMEFSSLVADPIESVNGKNAKVWQEGTQASFFGGTVLGGWAGEVKTFKEALEALEERYRTELGKIFEIGTGGPGEGAASTGRLQRQENLEAELTREATRLREAFDSDTEKRGAQMSSGPTPEVLKALVTDGDMGWAGWNLWGAASPVPLNAAEGAKLAAMLRTKILNGDKLTDADRELLIQLQALTGHALWMQKNGGDLSKNELAYLKTFYEGMSGDMAGLGEAGRGLNPNGMLWNVEDWMKNQNLAEDDVELIRETLGGGILALSDEGIGGGLGELPEQIQWMVNQEASGTYIDGHTYTASAFESNWMPIAGMLGAATFGLKGGLEFSGKTTLRMAEYTERVGWDEGVVGMQDILGASTRNHEANATLLSGGYRNIYGEDTPEYVLRNLFGNGWKDDGKAAAGLIDWIPEASTGSDSYERYLAGDASASLIDIMTNTEKNGDWDESAFQFFTDSGGHIGDDKHSPLGAENPLIAQAMGDVASNYLRSFGEYDNGDAWNTEYTGDHLRVDENDRTRFFQLVAGDPTARARLGDAIIAQAYSNSMDMVKGGDGVSGQLPAQSGRLLGYYNAAVTNNMFDKVAGLEGDQAKAAAEAAAKHAMADMLVSTVAGEVTNVTNLGIQRYDAHHPIAPLPDGTTPPRSNMGLFVRGLPGIANTALGIPLSMIADPSGATYNPNDVTYEKVAEIKVENFNAMNNHAMLKEAINQGLIDIKDVDPAMRDSSGTNIRDIKPGEDMDKVNGYLTGPIDRSDLGVKAVRMEASTFAKYKNVPGFYDTYEEYLQWRNNATE